LYRILYFEQAPSIGGSCFSLLQLVSGIDRSRFDPFVLFRYNLPVRKRFQEAGVQTAVWSTVTGEPEEEPPDTSPPRLPVYKKGGLYRLMWSVKRQMGEHRREAGIIVPWLESEGFALVHTNNFVFTNMPLISAARIVGIPSVSHQRGFFRLNPFQCFISRSVDRFLCVSQAVADHYIREGLPADKVSAVYNGVDTERLRPRDGMKRGDGDKLLVGFFGRLERWKGVDILLDSAGDILTRRDDVRFLIAGTGPEEKELKRRVDEDPTLKSGIELLGFREDALDLLAGCDIALNTSIEPEPLSRSALEALALGVPVIASNAGGNPEIVEHGRNGMLFENGDSAGLAEALDRLLSDESLRKSCSAEARLRAERLFSADRYVREIETVYSDILEN